VVLRLSGDDAFGTLDRVLPAALTLQDTQVRHTVLLREDGVVFADVYVARDDEAYFLLSEGPGVEALEAWLRQHATGPALEVRRLGETHTLLSLHGPWCWELLAACVGPDVMGMPYLSFLRLESGVLCFRTGKTGEYGYDLLVPTGAAAEFRAGLEQQGATYGLTPVSLPALEQCGLENWFFSIRREGRHALTPLELGLQWRLSPGKDFVGAEAVKARRRGGFTQRVTCLLAEGSPAEDAAVEYDGQVVGRVLASGESPVLGRVVTVALVDLPLAVPGLQGFVAGGHAARSVSPPVLNNRSLYVSAQRHTWADRETAGFPPLSP
jgi:aminomethyltransferase